MIKAAVAKENFDSKVSPKRILLFLDVDGVLHPEHCKIPNDFCMKELVAGRLDPALLGLLCRRRQRMLLEFLDCYPSVDIVISSAWRTWKTNGFLDWFLRLLEPGIAARVIGMTPVLGSHNPVFQERCQRRKEIREFVAKLPNRLDYVSGWIAVDDNDNNFLEPPEYADDFFYIERSDRRLYRSSLSNSMCRRDEVIVIVPGYHGLTEQSIKVLNTAVRHITLDNPDELCRAESFTRKIDIARLCDILYSELARKGRALAQIPAREWHSTRRSIMSILDMKFSCIVKIDSIDIGQTIGHALRLLSHILSQQLKFPFACLTEAELSTCIAQYFYQTGNPRFLIEICFSPDHFDQGTFDIIHGCLLRVSENTSALMARRAVLVLALRYVDSGPDRLKVSECTVLAHSIFEFPDPDLIPYCHDY